MWCALAMERLHLGQFCCDGELSTVAAEGRSKNRTGCRSMYSAHWRLLSRQLFSVAPKAPWFRKVMPSFVDRWDVSGKQLED